MPTEQVLRVLLTACMLFFSFSAISEPPELSPKAQAIRTYLLDSELHWQRSQFWIGVSYTELVSSEIPATFLFYAKISKAKKAKYECAFELEPTLERKLDLTIRWIQNIGWDVESFLGNIYEYAHEINYLAMTPPLTETKH